MYRKEGNMAKDIQTRKKLMNLKKGDLVRIKKTGEIFYFVSYNDDEKFVNLSWEKNLECQDTRPAANIEQIHLQRKIINED